MIVAGRKLVSLMARSLQFRSAVPLVGWWLSLWHAPILWRDDGRVTNTTNQNGISFEPLQGGGKQMKTGLFLSRDDGAISGTVDVDQLAKDYAHLSVASVHDNFYGIADQRDILKAVEDAELEAVILAGNSPNHCAGLPAGNQILDAIERCGVNENKIAFANLKEHIALPHKEDGEAATSKARLFIDSALAKLESIHETKSKSVAPRRCILVIGATTGGLTAARELLAKGYRVYLVDKQSKARTNGVEAQILPSLAAVLQNEKATLLFEANVKDVSGWCGDYAVIVSAAEGEDLEFGVGGIILSVGDDVEWINELKSKLQLDLDDDGQPRSRQRVGFTGDTRDPGIWFVPCPNGGDPFAAEVVGASIAVLSLTTLLDQNEINHPELISEVDESVCGGCGTCVKTCAFSASSIDLARKVSVIDERRCRGCGNCVVSCPTGARDLVSFPETAIFKSIDVLAQGVKTRSTPRVLALMCNGSGSEAMDAAGHTVSERGNGDYWVNVLPLQVECGGNVDTQYVLRAFQQGFDGVALVTCNDGHCHHIVGNTDMERRLSLFRDVLRSRRIDDSRLRILKVAADDGESLADELKSFCDDLSSQNGEEGGQ
jgi:F420-non-reducing hydrogenase iron-sulfur subunit